MPLSTNSIITARRTRLGCAVLVACTVAAGPHAFAADREPQRSAPDGLPTSTGQPHDIEAVDGRHVGERGATCANGGPGPRYYDIEAFKARSIRALGAHLMAMAASPRRAP